VLDVGCGPGDLSLVASRLVGPTGTVLAVDAADDISDRTSSWLTPRPPISAHRQPVHS